ncbi:hypothetical protein UVI_02048320 [Ustilaginoidea virens]|uniref:ML-like domain-containing protein n=1 Tax=Ustilaginoidea virens TaxID=1159556 RepID=A0A1B5KVR7_USTVR|nr:hypothetical protein UVI_02048320 [Ustilaginoidea virens]
MARETKSAHRIAGTSTAGHAIASPPTVQHRSFRAGRKVDVMHLPWSSLVASCRWPSFSHVRNPVDSRSRVKPGKPSLRQLSSTDTVTGTTRFLAMLVFALLTPNQVAAVRIQPTNCLPESFQAQKPPFIQWVPIAADARFDTANDKHNFRFIVWGNVTGSLNQQPLPGPGSRDWTNPNKTDGKIINSENSANGTTVKSSIGTLTSLYNLPSMNITNDMLSSYSFASFAATMLIIFGNSAGTNIGCISAVITPDLGKLSWVLKTLPLVVLLFSGFAVVFASIFSPWGSSNVFHWTSNYGRDADLLRLVTPGFGDCLQYLQFAVLSGALSLSYPGFYQPVVSQAGWSALMFNESFATHSPGWQSVRDGIYVTDTSDGYGLHSLGQLVGMRQSADIWAGMMVWLCVIILAVFALTQAGFLAQWLYRKIQRIPEEDLRAKNIPFSVGNVIRIVFNFLLIPVVALSCFQLVAAGESPAFTIALAAATLAVLFGFASYVLLLVIRTRPKSVLFDDLPTVLRYGPLYNTYCDEAAAYALIPVLLNIVRGVAIGAVQPSGISQVVLLAICEVIQVFTLHAFKPFPSPTSMNAYHTLFSVLRLACVLLMVAFVPSLGVTEGPKGWIGYAILLIHGGVLALGFFLGALQTVVEVVARLLGAGGDDVTGLTRGGLSKIFGMRQLSRRETHRDAASRASQLSSMAMLHAEEGSKTVYSMSPGRVRSASGASYGAIMAHHRHRSSSVLDSVDVYSAGHRHADTNSSYIPGTPGEASTFSFLASPTIGRPMMPARMEPADPYYRPPRRSNNPNLRESMYSDSPQNTLGVEAKPAKPNPGAAAEAADAAADEIPRGMTPAPPGGAMNLPANQPDYATREVDFYYGVRGPALNSDNPGRRLGTGPADPTGPVATATGWFRNWFGGKSKEKGKGFEVVRSSRMPPHMVRNGGFGDETPPEGIPVAMGVLRNGPIDSDDDSNDDGPDAKRQAKAPERRPDDLLTDDGDPRESDVDEPARPISPVISPISPGISPVISPVKRERSTQSRGRRSSSGSGELVDLALPDIPRKSSKRNSGSVDPRRLSALSMGSSRLSAAADHGSPAQATTGSHGPYLSNTPAPPSEQTEAAPRRTSSKSSRKFPVDSSQDKDALDQGPGSERPASSGTVAQINRANPPQLPPLNVFGDSADLLDDFSDLKHV